MTKNSTSTISKVVALSLATTAISLMSAQNASAATLNVNFTQLPGSVTTLSTGGTPTETGVFLADLSNLSLDNITSILFQDDNNGTGGQPGQFSGFDLDGIKLSTSLINDAANVNSIAGLNVFDFSPAGAVLTQGTQRAPVDPALFGTTGANINNTVATLGSFDGVSTNLERDGFVSIGDGGKVLFNLTSPLPTGTPLYLYVGEAGNNGEFPGTVAITGEVTPIVDPPVSVPEPTSLAALSLMGIYFAARRKQAAKTA